jgi:hypothetical protein
LLLDASVMLRYIRTDLKKGLPIQHTPQGNWNLCNWRELHVKWSKLKQRWRHIRLKLRIQSTESTGKLHVKWSKLKRRWRHNKIKIKNTKYRFHRQYRKSRETHCSQVSGFINRGQHYSYRLYSCNETLCLSLWKLKKLIMQKIAKRFQTWYAGITNTDGVCMYTWSDESTSLEMIAWICMCFMQCKYD